MPARTTSSTAGFNYRLDELRAALAIVQLGRLRQTQRRPAGTRSSVSGAPRRRRGSLVPVSGDEALERLLSPSRRRAPAREASAGRRSRAHARRERIQTSVHYPPIHRFTAYAEVGRTAAAPADGRVAERIVTLPLYPHMAPDDVGSRRRDPGLCGEQAGVADKFRIDRWSGSRNNDVTARGRQSRESWGLRLGAKRSVERLSSGRRGGLVVTGADSPCSQRSSVGRGVGGGRCRQDSRRAVVFSGLTEPTSIAFSARRPRLRQRERRARSRSSTASPTRRRRCTRTCARTCTAYDDRGLLGLALHPSFPTIPDVYVSYSHDAVIGGTAPRWGTPGANSDPCPTPPGPSLDGCVISGRLSRLTQSGGGGGPSYSASVLADSPRAYWRLGEASGTTAADASGNNRTGSYLNTPSLGAPGALTGDSNTAVSFNGVDEYVNVPYLAALNPTAFTVEAWAYPDGRPGNASARSSRAATTPPVRRKGYVLYAAPDNTWQLWTGSGRLERRVRPVHRLEPVDASRRHLRRHDCCACT